MIDMDAILKAAAAKKAGKVPEQPVKVPEQAPAVTETVVVEKVTVTDVAGAAYLMKDDAEWTWEDLRDYVMRKIEDFHGPQVRSATKESAVFRSFHQRHGRDAVRIARHAFEVQRGMWQRAPISVNRFCKGSDPYFADKIKSRLT